MLPLIDKPIIQYVVKWLRLWKRKDIIIIVGANKLEQSGPFNEPNGNFACALSGPLFQLWRGGVAEWQTLFIFVRTA